MAQLGDKIYKNSEEDIARYTETAIWCNSNDAHIEDKGSYYEVVANEPTVDEKLDALDAQYNADKERIRGAYQDAQIYGKTERMEQLRADLEALDAQYDIDYEAIVGGDE